MSDEYGVNSISVEWARKELVRLVGPERESIIYRNSLSEARDRIARSPGPEVGWVLFHMLNKVIDDLNGSFPTTPRY